MEVQKLLGAKQIVMESLSCWPVARSAQIATSVAHRASSSLRLKVYRSLNECQVEPSAAHGSRCLHLHMDVQLVPSLNVLCQSAVPFCHVRTNFAGCFNMRCRLVDEMRMTVPPL